MLTCRFSHPSGKLSFLILQNKVMPRIEGGRRKRTLRADGCSPISLKCSGGDLFKLARWQGVAAWGSLGQWVSFNFWRVELWFFFYIMQNLKEERNWFILPSPEEDIPQVNIRCVNWEHGVIAVRRHVRDANIHPPESDALQETWAPRGAPDQNHCYKIKG